MAIDFDILVVCLFRLFARGYVAISQRLKIRNKGLPSYVYEVSSQNSKEVIQ